MNSQLKELIENSTIDGIITEEARIFLYEKGELEQVSRAEVDIYINANLKKAVFLEKSANLKEKFLDESKRRRGWFFVIISIVDIPFVFVFPPLILSTIFFFIYGMSLLGKLDNLSWKTKWVRLMIKILWYLLVIFLSAVITERFEIWFFKGMNTTIRIILSIMSFVLLLVGSEHIRKRLKL